MTEVHTNIQYLYQRYSSANFAYLKSTSQASSARVVACLAAVPSKLAIRYMVTYRPSSTSPRTLASCQVKLQSPGWIVPKPADMTYEQAASLPTSFVSAYKLAKDIRSGSRVFVNGGSGGIGLILIQLLKNWKNANVTTTASDQSRHVVEKQHPDTIVNYREIDNLPDHLHELHSSFDYVIDLVGDTSLLQNSKKFLSPEGTFIAFGGGLASSSMLHFFSWLLRTIAVGILPTWLGESCKSCFTSRFSSNMLARRWLRQQVPLCSCA